MVYKTANKIMRILGTDREGERVGRRSTAFLKCRLPKGDAEPQVIFL